MKNIIRIMVVAGLLAWPTVEILRIQAANKQLAESELLGQSISQKLASLKKLREVAKGDTTVPATAPVVDTSSTDTKVDSESQ